MTMGSLLWRKPAVAFVRYKTCRLCDLWNTCRSVGIPGRLFAKCENVTNQCVCFVGEQPENTEDVEGECFVGKAGKKLDSFYVYGPPIQDVADIYATNTVRCKPGATKPSANQLKACRPYLLRDIDTLSRRYERVLLVPVGSYAVKALTGRGLTEQFKHPFEYTPSLGLNVWIMGTYHPAYLLRDPRHQGVVMEHMNMVREWLLGKGIEYEEMPDVERAPLCTDDVFTKGGRLVFDLETYGCLKNGRDQTVFHPKKMVAFDHMRRDNIITTMHIAWYDPKKVLRLGYFLGYRSDHIRLFIEWLRRAGELGGQNITYDAKCVRYCYGEDTIPRWKPVVDSVVKTFLLNDLHPRALKAIVPLYRITEYNDEPSCVKAYTLGAKLYHYGCKDAWSTLRAIDIADARMKQLYTETPNACNKVSLETQQWFSDSLWSQICLEESGVPYDTDRLLKVHNDTENVLKTVLAEALDKFGYKLVGGGSAASIQKLFLTASMDIEKLLTDKQMGASLLECKQIAEDKRDLRNLERTPTGRLKTNKDTSNFLQGIAPAGSEIALALALLAEVSSAKKTLGAYTGPRLYGKPKRILYHEEIVEEEGKIRTKRTNVGFVYDYRLRLVRLYDRRGRYTGVAMSYPSWFILPKSDDKGKQGGVRQYRWSAKDHAVQTDKKDIKACMTSRYKVGVVGAGDYSQMEWRMAAFISGDDVMLREIEEGIDPHIETASILLGVELTNEQAVRAWLYGGAIRVLCRSPQYQMRTEARGLRDSKPSEYPREFIEFVVAYCRQEGGKSQNFGYLFGATAPTIQKTGRIKAGFEVPLACCNAVIENNNGKYKGLMAFRRGQMNEAIQLGQIHLPILGVTRTFTDDPEDIRGKYRGQVYDFAIQALSGLVLQCAITELLKWRTATGLDFHVIINNHDAMYVDMPWQNAPTVMQEMKNLMLDNWFLRQLEAHYGRRFPIKVKMELAVCRGLLRSKPQQLVDALNEAS
mgnify:CR=1 FL=1